MTILILGGGEDEHASHMLRHLQTQGADVELLDTRWFPSRMGLTFDPLRQEGFLRLPTGRKVEFHQIRSVYWRNYYGPQSPPLPDAMQSYIASNDSRGLLESLLIYLRTRWVNGWSGFQMHQTKPVQLARVAALGVTIPTTMLTNDPEAARAFAGRHPRSIFKPVQGGAHTLRLTPAYLTQENLQNLAVAPVTLQEEVPGTNIRVFVAGSRVLSCEVRTKAVDFRDDANSQITPHSLPPLLEETCKKIADCLDLLWTGIDFRLSPSGQYVFLEANPSPMFIGFESRTGLPLTESLAALLLEPEQNPAEN